MASSSQRPQDERHQTPTGQGYVAVTTEGFKPLRGASTTDYNTTPNARPVGTRQSKSTIEKHTKHGKTHTLTLVFSELNSQEKWQWNRKVKGSEHLKMFQQMVCAHLQLTKNGGGKRQRGSAGRKGLGEVSCKNHGNKKTATGWTIGVSVLVSRYRIKRP